MKQVRPYLIFPGSCRDALEHYSRCLGGEVVSLRTYDEAPIDFPSEHGDRVFNSELRAQDLCIMASDNLPSQEHVAGTNVALYAMFSDDTALDQAFEGLCDGGSVLMPLRGGFGMLVDRFGVRWMLTRRGES